MKLVALDYADDIALFEEIDVEMAKTTEAIRAIAWKLGLKMSYIKTEIMSIGQASGSNLIQWRNRRGQGGRVPPETSDREISADVPGKKETRKMEKGGKWKRKEGEFKKKL